MVWVHRFLNAIWKPDHLVSGRLSGIWMVTVFKLTELLKKKITIRGFLGAISEPSSLTQVRFPNLGPVAVTLPFRLMLDWFPKVVLNSVTRFLAGTCVSSLVNARVGVSMALLLAGFPKLCPLLFWSRLKEVRRWDWLYPPSPRPCKYGVVWNKSNSGGQMSIYY